MVVVKAELQEVDTLQLLGVYQLKGIKLEKIKEQMI
jgi:hypothetical protein